MAQKHLIFSPFICSCLVLLSDSSVLSQLKDGLEDTVNSPIFSYNTRLSKLRAITSYFCVLLQQKLDVYELIKTNGDTN